MFKQHLIQKGQHKLSPQQLKLIKLIELPILALEEHIYNEVLDNPLLEYSNNDNILYNTSDINNINEKNLNNLYESNNSNIIDTSSINIDEYLSDGEVPSYRMNNIFNKHNNGYLYRNIQHKISFHEYLKQQVYLYNLDDIDTKILYFIIDNLDNDGYLRVDEYSLLYDIKSYFNVEINYDYLEFLLIHYIHSFHPYGVGARNLQECLMIQLKYKEGFYYKIAYHIIKYYFYFFYKKQYSKIMFKLNINNNDFKYILNIILKLHAQPGKLYINNMKSIFYIIPDFYIKIINQNLVLSLNKQNIPKINISYKYLKFIYMYNNYFIHKDKKTFFFLKKKLEDAKSFIESIKKREQTLKLTMEAIINYQKEYFMSGDFEKLKPMVLKDISSMINIDISTVSRIANSKYVSTPYGVYLLKKFFSEGILVNEGVKVSTLTVKHILLEMISKENKENPLNDIDIMRILNKKGYFISRRTIAKYRHDLNIPISRLRVCI